MAHLMLMCRYGETSACKKVNGISDIESLYSFIRNRWPEIPSSLYMGYSFTDITQFCEIRTQEDYIAMLDVAKEIKTRLIPITIHNCRPTPSTYIEDNDIALHTSASTSQVIVSDVPTSIPRPIDDIESNIRYSMISRWSDAITGENQIFEGGANEFREELVKHSLYVGFEFKYIRNNDYRIKAVCKFSNAGKDLNFPISGSGCPWFIHAVGSGENTPFIIKKFRSEHTCGAGAITRTNSRFNSTIISQIVNEKMKFNETYSARDLQLDLQKEYGLDVSYGKAWHAIEKANEARFGDYKISFDQLRNYCVRAAESNPGSHISFECDNEGRFLRVFIAFHACIEGFNYCRPMLFCDSTFLKGRYRGQMFAATAKDGNQQLFQVAYAVVNSETIENWEWFFRHMQVILNPNRVVTFISDRNQGLTNAISSIFPSSPHGYCTEHLKNNLRTALSGRPAQTKEHVKNLFNKVIYATNVEYCNQKLEKMKRIGGQKVIDFLNGLDLIHYSEAYFKGERYGEMTSNAAESLNSKFRNERGLPLLGLVDAIRIRIMTDMAAKRDVSASWEFAICPNIDKELSKRISIGRLWEAIKCSDHIFEVRAKFSVTVNLTARTCTCMKWQLHKLPCAHALCAILKSGLKLINYIDEYYLTPSYRNTYALPLYPVSTLYQPAHTTSYFVKPPICKVQAGRPKNNRIRSIGEPRRQMVCSRCCKRGHNRKGCRESVTQ